MIILTLVVFSWVPRIMVTPDTIPLGGTMSPLIAADYQGNIWFAWAEDHDTPGTWGILARYYENGILSTPDTLIPTNQYMYLRGLTRQQNGNIWLLVDNDSDMRTRYYDGNQWSGTVQVPYYGFFSGAGADSADNYWVTWSTDLYGYWSVQSSFYNGNLWSSMIPVSDRPYIDCASFGMATSRTGTLWNLWTGGLDTLFVSIYNGASWESGIPIATNIRSPAYIVSSLTDSSIIVSWRHDNNMSYVVRYSSFGGPADTIWTSTTYETTPAIACDDLGQIWMFFCDSLDVLDYLLYYSVANSDSVTTPALVDTEYAYNPRAIFDPYHRRIWVAYRETWIMGNQAIYATYTAVDALSEEYAIGPQNNSVLTCFPNPVCDGNLIIQYTVPTKTHVNMSLCDVTGKTINEFFNGEHDAWVYRKIISTADLASGVYFLRTSIGSTIIVKKIIVLY